MLIEVMVGAVVLAIATRRPAQRHRRRPERRAPQNKARSTAAALAEQDQERMRSLPVATLPRLLAPTRTVTVAGVDYTVVSSWHWVTDTGGSISCSNNAKTAANIRIQSRVTSNATGGNDRPGRVSSRRRPGSFATGEGRAIVKVADRDGGPMAGRHGQPDRRRLVLRHHQLAWLRGLPVRPGRQLHRLRRAG